MVWAKQIFSSSTEAFFNHAVYSNCTSIGTCSAIKTNQWLGSGVEPMAMQPAIAWQIGVASGYISARFAAASQISSLPFLADFSLMPRFAVEMPLQLDWISCRDQLADPVYPLPPSGDDLKESHKTVNFSAALLQMPHRHCKTCRSPLHADDSHTECVSCLGKSHANAALSGAECSQEFQSRLSALADSFLFRELLRPSHPPVFFLSGTCEEKQRGRGFEWSVTSEPTSAQCPRASPSPQREHSLVLFTQLDPHPYAPVSDMISFGGSIGRDE